MNNDKCQCECKNPIKDYMCEKDYAYNPSICAYEYVKDHEIGEYLKNCLCMKSLVDDQVVTCDEIVNMPEANWWILMIR